MYYYTFNDVVSYGTRSANDPPPNKGAMGKSGNLFNGHFVGCFLIPHLIVWLREWGVLAIRQTYSYAYSNDLLIIYIRRVLKLYKV